MTELPKLDHVAIHVFDRASFAAELVERLDVHVIEQTDRFTLLGANAEDGKITLLDPVDDREPTANRIVSLVLAEAPGADAPPPLVMTGGLVLTFVSIDRLGPEWQGTARHALVGVTIRASDPVEAARQLDDAHALHATSTSAELAVIEVGSTRAGGRLTLSREEWEHDDRPSMLDHVGVRVVDAAQVRTLHEASGREIARWVDAEHSRAVFIDGPESLLIEYVELTAPLES